MCTSKGLNIKIDKIHEKSLRLVLNDHQSILDRMLDTLTLPSPCISESCIKIKINLNFYFNTSLWSLEMFYEGLSGLTH